MSAAVTITIDADRLLDAQPGTELIEKISDYASACLLLRRALQTGEPLVLGVRQRTVAVWLTTLAARYPDMVEVKRYTPRDALSAHWHISVPPGVTDVDIMQSRLLEVQPLAREGQNFNDLLLEHFLSGLLLLQTLNIAHLAALLNGYDEAVWKAALRRPLVARALKERLDGWQAKAQTDYAQQLVTLLRDDPGTLKQSLCDYKVLRNYPQFLGDKMIGGLQAVLRRAKVDTDALEMKQQKGPAATEVQYYLTGIRCDVREAQDIATLLDQMSGHLDVELDFVDKLLRDNPEWITTGVLARMAKTFRPLHSRIGTSLAALGRLIKPAFPPAPQPDWTADQWLHWTHDSYMPYYAWLDVQNRQDDTLSAYAVLFADWFYAHFIALKNAQPERFSFAALYRKRHDIEAGDHVTIALMLDNFNYVYFEELRRLFQTQGMSLMDSEPLFSLIPTATEVGKAALIANYGDQIDVKDVSYPSLVAKEWNNNAGKKAVYLPNIGALQELSAQSHNIYFLNYLPIDETLHEDVQQTGRLHGEVIQSLLTKLAESIADFARRFGLQKRLRVYVVSDHGATRIEQGVANVLDQSYYKSLAVRNHHRYVELSDQKFAALTQSVASQCYLIDRNKFKTNHNYLAARQYYRFIQTTANFYVHGGLSPEEVIVPFARFTFDTVVPDDLTLTLLNNQFRFSVKARIQIEVGNPNGFPVDAVTVRLTDADAEEVALGTLGAKQAVPIELATTFRKTVGAAASRPLTARVRYTYQGTEYTPPDKEFLITIKSMMEEASDGFDDL